jgi:soluble P-type ATPase
MISIHIPGRGELVLGHLVLDYNGTIALDGNLCPGVAEKLAALEPHLQIHVITADTHGTVKAKIADLNCTLAVIGPDHQDRAKLDYIKGLGPQSCVGIGNGRNDAAMLAAAALGIAVIGPEGAAAAAVAAADVIAAGIDTALDLLLKPLRLTATLRN